MNQKGLSNVIGTLGLILTLASVTLLEIHGEGKEIIAETNSAGTQLYLGVAPRAMNLPENLRDEPPFDHKLLAISSFGTRIFDGRMYDADLLTISLLFAKQHLFDGRLFDTIDERPKFPGEERY